MAAHETGPRVRAMPPTRARVVRRRRFAALTLVVLAVLVLEAVVGGGGDFFAKARSAGTAGTAAAGGGPSEAGTAAPQLPGGGREIFPGRRVVAFYGAPQEEALGALGIGTPAEAAERLAKQAEPYEREGPVTPAFELIATVASSSPGSDDRYRNRQEAAVVRRYLDAAREAGALLILDIQPGRSDFMEEVRVFEEFLREPDVSLALDPEWHVGEGELPGDTIGSVTAAEVNEVGAYLSGIVEDGDLPQKLLVVHQFTEDMITERDALEDHPGVALTLNVDGFGGQDVKIAKYEDFTRGRGAGEDDPGDSGEAGASGGGSSAATGGRASSREDRPIEDVPYHHGFKLFYEEDTDLLSPREVLALRPRPDLIVYE